MKKLSFVFAGLILALSAGLVQADDASSEKQEYIPWTWDDISD